MGGGTDGFKYERSEVFVVNVNWNADNRKWNVNTWQLDNKCVAELLFYTCCGSEFLNIFSVSGILGAYMRNKLSICKKCGASVREGESHYMSLPLPDIVDRYTITKLKADRFSKEQKAREPLLEQELETYEFAIARIRKDFPQVDQWIKQLYAVNNAMWDCEWEIRAHDDSGAPLEKIGKVALRMRTENGKRAKVRNVIVHETGHGFFDHKVGHSSEVK